MGTSCPLSPLQVIVLSVQGSWARLRSFMVTQQLVLAGQGLRDSSRTLPSAPEASTVRATPLGAE